MTESGEDWAELAPCRGLTDVFYAFNPKPALVICGDCPVVTECLESTLEWEKNERTRHGVAGGMTAEQRYQIAESGR